MYTSFGPSASRSEVALVCGRVPQAAASQAAIISVSSSARCARRRAICTSSAVTIENIVGGTAPPSGERRVMAMSFGRSSTCPGAGTGAAQGQAASRSPGRRRSRCRPRPLSPSSPVAGPTQPERPLLLRRLCQLLRCQPEQHPRHSARRRSPARCATSTTGTLPSPCSAAGQRRSPRRRSGQRAHSAIGSPGRTARSISILVRGLAQQIAVGRQVRPREHDRAPDGHPRAGRCRCCRR